MEKGERKQIFKTTIEIFRRSQQKMTPCITAILWQQLGFPQDSGEKKQIKTQKLKKIPYSPHPTPSLYRKHYISRFLVIGCQLLTNLHDITAISRANSTSHMRAKSGFDGRYPNCMVFIRWNAQLVFTVFVNLSIYLFGPNFSFLGFLSNGRPTYITPVCTSNYNPQLSFHRHNKIKLNWFFLFINPSQLCAR